MKLPEATLTQGRFDEIVEEAKNSFSCPHYGGFFIMACWSRFGIDGFWVPFEEVNQRETPFASLENHRLLARYVRHRGGWLREDIET